MEKRSLHNQHSLSVNEYFVYTEHASCIICNCMSLMMYIKFLRSLARVMLPTLSPRTVFQAQSISCYKDVFMAPLASDETGYIMDIGS